MKEALDSKTLIEEAYLKIKQMIFQQRVAPGQRLIYQDLCELLKMSRTPIINALIRLEQEGFLVSQAHRGFCVKPIDLKEAWDLFGVREALEVYAVELAINRIEDTSIETFEEKFRNHQEYMPNFYDRRKFRLDAEFHIQISIIAGNQALEKLLRTNLEHVYLRYKLQDYSLERMADAIKEHRSMINRICARDIKGAVELMRIHVRSARDSVIATLSREDQDEEALALSSYPAVSFKKSGE